MTLLYKKILKNGNTLQNYVGQTYSKHWLDGYEEKVSCMNPKQDRSMEMFSAVHYRRCFFIVPKHKTKQNGEKGGAELNLHTPSESWQCMYAHYQCLCNPYEMTVTVKESI
jgi:hypothetical protein